MRTINGRPKESLSNKFSVSSVDVEGIAVVFYIVVVESPTKLSHHLDEETRQTDKKR
jgi:hypothetical protein